MARLNESAASAESIDALRRRFVRQNREIARVNSIQSLRIRGLESEISRLLSENVSLREQVISLSQEVERFQAAKMLNNGIYDIKKKLDVKLAELNSLVVDLGKLPRKFGRECVEGADSMNFKQSNHPSVEWRRRATSSEYNQILEDGRLPVILEDKYYPRKTLEPTDLQDLMSSDADVPESPNPGQPQTTQQDSEDLDLNTGALQSLTQNQMPSTGMKRDDALLPPTLETREIMNPGFFISKENPRYTLKPGSKRKFGSGDDDNNRTTSISAGDDAMFQFNPSVHSSQDTNPHFAPAPGSPLDQEQIEEEQGAKNHALSKRKALEPKDTNANITSSNKPHGAVRNQRCHQKSGSDRDEHPAPYKPVGKKHGIHGEKCSDGKSGCHNLSQHEQQCKDENDVTGRVPSDERLPSSLETPATRLQVDSGTTLGIPSAPCRTTRRQRAVVSYAEPNLRDKMRRSTNEFVDAVAGRNSRRASSSHTVEENMNDNDENRTKAKANMKGTLGQCSDSLVSESDAAVKDFDSMPQESFDSHSGKRLMSMVSKRKRRTISENEYDSLSPRDIMEALEAGLDSRIQKGSAIDREHQREDCGIVEKQMADDGSATHPAARHHTAPAELSTKICKVTSSTKKPSRRHSSNPRAVGQGPSPQCDMHSIESQHISSSKHHLQSSVPTMPWESEEHVVEDEISQMPLVASKSDAQSTSSLTMNARQIKRGQRFAARRRSMML